MRFHRWFRAATLGVFGVLGLAIVLAFAGGPARAAEFTDAQRTEMGAVIREYLVKNPEVLQEAMTELDHRQKAEELAVRRRTVGEKSEVLFHAPDSVVIGNQQGKVTLVEFFDYNCGYCKRALEDIGQLLRTEPELRLVLKDFPVLGPGSVEAAQVAGAVRNQLKGDAFWQFHSKLLSTRGQVGKAQALAAAKDAGVNMDQLARDMSGRDIKATIAATMEVADALSLTGTPSFVVGEDVVVGAVGYDSLKQRIDSVLKCGKAECS